MTDARTWAIILAGGEGTRLSALTTALYGHPLPKQFAAIDDTRSMLQATVARVERLVPRERIVVIVGPSHVDLARQQLAAFEGVALLTQPAGLGTAVALIYGAAWIRTHDPAGNILVFPSDHYVADERGFLDAARDASNASRRLDRVALVGTPPDAADPDYGWIVPGARVERGVRAVGSFVEKPTRSVASRLQREGGLWNTFVFAAPLATFADLARAHLPLHAARFDAWASDAASIGETYRDLPAADFSRDVLQRARGLLLVAMADVGWSDWGTPERVFASLRGKPAESRLRERLQPSAAMHAMAGASRGSTATRIGTRKAIAAAPARSEPARAEGEPRRTGIEAARAL